MAFLDEAGLAELWSLIKAKDEALAAADVKIATGSYTGTGENGASSKNSLTFDFEPKLLVVGKTLGSSYSKTTHMIAVSGVDHYGVVSICTNYDTRVTFSGNTVTWYCGDGADCQFNESGTTYYYFAIG